jgi:outer membrane protein assembly factor BamD
VTKPLPASIKFLPLGLRSAFLRRSLAVAAVAAMLPLAAHAQTTTPTTVPPVQQTTASPDGSTTTTTTSGVDLNGKPTASVTTTKTFGRGKKKADKVVATKDSKKNLRSQQKNDALIGADSRLPDKQLYDKAEVAMKKGHFDVARLDLQTMLNTYPDSQYQMRAKLAIADSWYKEGGTAALTQAESEYADFRVFFPNVPEAAEAQMRIGDIYFREMDKPDRDYAKALHAEEEYRRMLTDYPDSSLVPQAKQRLREVQEVLATREADIGAYYASRENYAAAIARLQTVADTYRLYSHMDDVLIGLGDAYEAQARYVRNLQVPAAQRAAWETAKSRLEKLYDTQAANYYREVVLEHSAAPHVEDARDRLAAMGLPIPEPTPEQAATSQALENSRGQYKLATRATLLFTHTADTVSASSTGDPGMVNPKTTTAPAVASRMTTDYRTAFDPKSATLEPAASVPAAATEAATAPAPAEAAPAAAAAPLAFQDVQTAGAGGSAPTADLTASPGGSASGSGGSVGVEIIKAATPATAPAAEGVPDPNDGLKAVGPVNSGPLPARDTPSGAPDRINDITQATPAAQTPAANGKKSTPAFDKKEESSSKHKKKKGIKKIVEPL